MLTLTIKDYLEIKDLTYSEVKDIDVSPFEKIKLILDYFNSNESYDSFTIIEYNNFMKEYEYLLQDPKEIKIDIKPFTFGNYIDLFTFFDKQPLKFAKIFGINEEDEAGKYIYCRNYFMKYYNNLKEKYPIIYVGEQNEDIDTTTIVNRKERKDVEEQQNKEKLQQRFSWLSIVYYLSNNDITKYNEIVGLSNLFVHNWLGYSLMKDKGQI